MNLKGLLSKLKSFIIECKRVWIISRKPTREEFKMIVKVTGIGMLIIGAIGFIINMVWILLK
jgi:protein transport protein SEC61 subunit gamma-like protein